MCPTHLRLLKLITRYKCEGMTDISLFVVTADPQAEDHCHSCLQSAHTVQEGSCSVYEHEGPLKAGPPGYRHP